MYFGKEGIRVEAVMPYEPVPHGEPGKMTCGGEGCELPGGRPREEAEGGHPSPADLPAAQCSLNAYAGLKVEHSWETGGVDAAGAGRLEKTRF